MKLNLSDVTLCAVSSVNVEATIFAMIKSMEGIDFGAKILLTDVDINAEQYGIRVIPIDRIDSSIKYSEFILQKLVDYIDNRHCLLVQWDGFVTHCTNWNAKFLEYDYVGAPWPQFNDGCDVGNGGFSIRSRRLLEFCRQSNFIQSHPEDVCICRVNRTFLEDHGMRFPNAHIASQFSYERCGEFGKSFGFHGVFNMIEAIGVDKFWYLYQGLDDRSTLRHDARRIFWQLVHGGKGLRRSTKFALESILRIQNGDDIRFKLPI